MKIMNEERGITLVELLVGLAVISLIMLGVVGILKANTRTQIYTQGKGQEIQQISSALDAIQGELENALAKSITVSTTTTTDDTISYVKVVTKEAIRNQRYRRIVIENGAIVIKDSVQPPFNPIVFTNKRLYAGGLVQSLRFTKNNITNDEDVTDLIKRKTVDIVIVANPVDTNDKKPITYRTTATTMNIQ